MLAASTRTIDTAPVCASCGMPLPGDAPKGFCPRCLADLAAGDNLIQGGSTPKVQDLTRQRFSDYELLGQIAEGGMGIVHLARQISLNRVVVLKMIRSCLLYTSDAADERSSVDLG